MTQRFDLKLHEHMDDPDRKRVFNEAMFSTIAREYDLITRVLSFGRDPSWKKEMIASLPEVRTPLCVDLACGTGDLCFLLAQRYKLSRIIGIDLTERMLEIARKRNTHRNVTFALGDMTRIGLPDECADIVTGGYALRNAPRLDVTLSEVRRILKPTGVAVFLDFSKPAGSLQQVEMAALTMWGGLWGLLLHGNPELYTYIPASLKRFPDRHELRKYISRSGLQVTHSKLHFFGVVEVLQLRRI